jgi:hypothetical protein
MRIGVSSSGRWRISMGPLGWLLTIWFVLPLLAAWYAAVVLGWLCVLTCRAIAAHRVARRAT